LVRFFALLLSVFLVGVSMSLMGGVAIFLNLPSLLLVAGCGVLLTIGAHGAAPFVAAVRAGWDAAETTAHQRARHRQVLRTLRNALCSLGAAGFVMGSVQMLSSLADPTAIGPAMVVSLLTVLYAVVLAELVVAPVLSRLRGPEDGHASVRAARSARGLATMGMTVIGTSGLLATLFGAF
jgi:flagellar motor component MotA